MSVLLTAALVATLSSAPLSAPEPQGPQTRVAPRGDYARSCSGAYVNRGRLYADCRDMGGRLRGTSIALAPCANDEIRNDDGVLVCGRFRGQREENRPGYPGALGPGGPGGGWGGGWGRASINVYEDADYRGRWMRFDQPMANISSTQMNDRISSMRLQGRWEVCTDAYFRGACRVIDGDVRNLGSTGFNDRISSLRPVGRR